MILRFLLVQSVAKSASGGPLSSDYAPEALQCIAVALWTGSAFGSFGHSSINDRSFNGFYIGQTHSLRCLKDTVFCSFFFILNFALFILHDHLVASKRIEVKPDAYSEDSSMNSFVCLACWYPQDSILMIHKIFRRSRLKIRFLYSAKLALSTLSMAKTVGAIFEPGEELSFFESCFHRNLFIMNRVQWTPCNVFKNLAFC